MSRISRASLFLFSFAVVGFVVRGAPAQGPSGSVAASGASSDGAGSPEPTPQAALAAIGGEALDITAEKLEVSVDQGTAVLEGNVKLALGDLVVACPRVDIRYDQAPQVQWAKGTGGVRAHFKDIEAKASVVEVDIGKRELVLSGGVHLKRGRGWVKAGQAKINLASRKVSLSDVQGSIPVEKPQR